MEDAVVDNSPIASFKRDKLATFIEDGFRSYLIIGEPFYDEALGFIMVYSINEDGTLFLLIWDNISPSVIRESKKYEKFMEDLQYCDYDCHEYEKFRIGETENCKCLTPGRIFKSRES